MSVVPAFAFAVLVACREIAAVEQLVVILLAATGAKHRQGDTTTRLVVLGLILPVALEQLCELGGCC
ncbi:hypothetical protein NUW87_04845 [Corynebacterium pilbarense]|uniref:Uncharacterized protein n=1 Tax=Corynebacterium pilbarense TaxID=1288393 RepID=A0A9Q4IGU0_9CORY|nr:hypothetical protein [Corynebacterium pilbarense]MCZ2220701.1 hypothetical protein [Corynebacterium pilbarense]